MLLSNTDLKDSQRVSILAASVSNVRTNTYDKTPSKDELLEEVKYESITSVLRQCEQKIKGGSIQGGRDLLNANQASGAKQSHSHSQHNNRNCLPEQIAKMQMKFLCHTCNRYGHCAKEHKSDGSIRSRVKSCERSTNESQNSNQSVNLQQAASNGKKSALDLNSRFVPHSAKTLRCNIASAVNADFELWPLVDDGAPYRAIGEFELQLLRLLKLVGVN